MSLLVRFEILGLFVNTVTANDMYSYHFRKIFDHPIQMQSSKKQIVLSEFL